LFFTPFAGYYNSVGSRFQVKVRGEKRKKVFKVFGIAEHTMVVCAFGFSFKNKQPLFLWELHLFFVSCV
jgi:hypothetical protein